MSSSERRYIDVYVESSELCPEDCMMRWKAEDEPRPVARVRYTDDMGVTRDCRVFGRTRSEGGGGGERSVRAMAVTVEDSSSGTAVLIYGGDLGLELLPDDGSARMGQPYLMLGGDDVLG
jgi:hypothetical protein